MESELESVLLPVEVMRWSTTGSSGERWENRAKAETQGKKRREEPQFFISYSRPLWLDDAGFLALNACETACYSFY